MEKLNHKFHSTGQFRNVIKNIETSSQFRGFDSNGDAIFDKELTLPTVEYIGTVKVHGTNASIIVSEDGIISFHSKKRLLGQIGTDGGFALLSDNSEFAQSMHRRLDGVKDVINLTKRLLGDGLKYPLKISGEWAGQGIQKGVGVSFLPHKTFIIFGIKNGETNQDNKNGWIPLDSIGNIHSNYSHIYNIMQFNTYKLIIDFNNPEYSQNTLVKNTNEVEECCPVSDFFNIKEDQTGEGIVYQPVSKEYCWDSGNWFKVKGEKHSISKVRTLASICPEKLDSIQKFVEYSVTENRLEQGIGEVGLEQSRIGDFIAWINRDINNEEGDVLESNSLSMKDVGKKISTVSREYYINTLNNNL